MFILPPSPCISNSLGLRWPKAALLFQKIIIFFYQYRFVEVQLHSLGDLWANNNIEAIIIFKIIMV